MHLRLTKIVAQHGKRTGIWFGIAVLGLACMVNVSPGGTGDPKSRNEAAQTSQASPANTQREGTKMIQTIGYFRQASGRVTFTPKDNSKAGFTCLENLMLQRVAEVLTDQTEFGEWIVNGELTEFRSMNYLILKTAQRVE